MTERFIVLAIFIKKTTLKLGPQRDKKCSIISDNGLTLNQHLLDVYWTRQEGTEYQMDGWQNSAKKRDVESILF